MDVRKIGASWASVLHVRRRLEGLDDKDGRGELHLADATEVYRFSGLEERGAGEG